MKSMTAYAQVSLPIKSRQFRIELQSLNKKGLDIQTDLPQSFLSLNILLRLYLASKLERGSVLLRIKEESDVRGALNEKDLNNLKFKLNDLATKTGYTTDVVSFGMLLDKALFLQPEDVTMEDLEPYLKTCIELLVKMRLNEGQRLAQDFLARFNIISDLILQIEKMQNESPQNMKEKLLERLKKLELSNFDEERLLKEVIYYVEKNDVTEELTRLKSHVEQMRNLLNVKEPCGRKLEFLVQECFRELNTLAAKTSELSVVNATLQLKVEFEKIKEQVMNVE